MNSDKSRKCCPPTDGGELVNTGRLVGFRETLSCEGIPEIAYRIILNSRQKSTLTNYESAWRKSASLCLESANVVS